MPTVAKKKVVQRAAPKSVFGFMAEGALRGYLAPRIAQDAALDLKPVIAALGVPKKDAKTGKVSALDHDKFKIALDAALQPKNGTPVLAMDADVADIQELLSQLDDMAPQVADLVVGGGAADPAGPPGSGDPLDAAPADTTGAAPPDSDGSPVPGEGEKKDPAAIDPDGDGDVDNADPIAKVMTYLADKLSPEDLEAIKKMFGTSDVAEDKKLTKPAMDAAIDAALKKEKASHKALREAEEAVMPIVGKIRVAMDSAADVYKLAFKKLGVKSDGVDPSAFPAIIAAHVSAGKRVTTTVAMDSDDSKKKPIFGEALSRFK